MATRKEILAGMYRHLCEKQGVVCRYVNQLFGAEPSRPNIIFGVQTDYLISDARPHTTYSAGFNGAYLGRGVICIDPVYILVDVEGFSNHGIELDPLLEIERTLAKEYAVHVHNYLHGNHLDKEATELTNQYLDSDQQTKIAFPFAFLETVSFVAPFGYARGRHRDDFMRARELQFAHLARNQVFRGDIHDVLMPAALAKATVMVPRLEKQSGRGLDRLQGRRYQK